MFFVIAPYNRATGGVELAHQMCAQLNHIEPDCAKMAYFDNGDASFFGFPLDQNGPAVYDKYVVSHAISFEEIDHEGNVVIIPEGITPIVELFHKAKRVIWWMSVDGYLSCFDQGIPTNLDRLTRMVDLHLYQSEYARDYLQKNLPAARALKVTDYINELYGTFLYPGAYRKNVVLYNPSKGLDIVLQLQKVITEIEWVPIVNLASEELMILMQTAKVYVDFGNHPGKDRIPREAAVNGCCVITNKMGSAAYTEDVPIPEKYKFDNPVADALAIKQLILDICEHYEEHQKEFDSYRERIRGERKQFAAEVEQFYQYYQKERYAFIDIAGTEYENAKIKNQKIADTTEEYLIFANGDVVSAHEVADMLSDYHYMDSTPLLVLCGHAPKTNDLYGLIEDLRLETYAMVVRRELFSKVGAFNDRLVEGINREFLCRAVQECNPIFLECSDVEWKQAHSEGEFFTNAYLLVRYLKQLTDVGRMEELLDSYMAYARDCGQDAYFETCINQLLAPDRKLYQKIYLSTAPFFIIRGGDTCYGVLRTFADRFAEALEKRGQRVIITSGNSMNDEQFGQLKTERFRGIIGFQAAILLKPIFHGIQGNRFNFWLDHPMFFHPLLDQMDTPVIFLCQDGDHADYMERMCQMGHGLHFPPAVVPVAMSAQEKVYDISFMGTYFDADQMWTVVNHMEGELGELAREVAAYLLENPDVNYNWVSEHFLGKYPQLTERYSYEVIMEHLWEACRIAPYTYRSRVIRKILDAGYELHVYGDSWKAYPKQDEDRLICHAEVSPEEIARVIGQSKISLNVMTWHKAGMTERIMEIMMGGSVCLTDETRYLKDHFTQMEDIAMFRLDALDQLPDIIDQLLQDDSLRCKITEHAYQKVMSEHTWDVRVAQFMDMVKEMEEAL